MKRLKRVAISEEIAVKMDELAEELLRLSEDPVVRDEAEELHRRITTVPPEELGRPFNI